MTTLQKESKLTDTDGANHKLLEQFQQEKIMSYDCLQ